jgi:hypothetical protein
MVEGLAKLERETVRPSPTSFGQAYPQAQMPRRSTGFRSMSLKLLRRASIRDAHGRGKGVEDELIDDLIPVGPDIAILDILKGPSVTSGLVSGCRRWEMLGLLDRRDCML